MELPTLSLAQRLVAGALLVAAEPDAFADLLGLDVGTYATPYALTYVMLGWIAVGLLTDRRVVATAKTEAAITVTRAVASAPETIANDERYLQALRDAGIQPEAVAAALAREKKRARKLRRP